MTRIALLPSPQIDRSLELGFGGDYSWQHDPGPTAMMIRRKSTDEAKCPCFDRVP